MMVCVLNLYKDIRSVSQKVTRERTNPVTTVCPCRGAVPSEPGTAELSKLSPSSLYATLLSSATSSLSSSWVPASFAAIFACAFFWSS